MSRTIRFIVLVAAVVCLTAVFATSAFAYSNFFAPCFSCHGGAPNPIAVTVTPTTDTATTQSYSVSAPGATEWAVFAGYTRIAYGMGTGGTFTVPKGAPYAVYAVKGAPATGSYGVANINPTYAWPDPTGDVTPPVSTSDAVASYTNQAVITITATDDQAGVQWIYFRVNGGSTRTTPVGVDGFARAVIRPTSAGTTNYTLEFWAQDREGNTEDPRNTASFTITADGYVSTAVPSTITGPNGSSPWTYQDASDAAPKREGGYVAYGGVSGFYSNPHGGYDTSTNKCKVCHAVHRAEGTYYLLRASSQDDACDYCHIGGAAHSNKIVYTGNDAGKYTPNGHTMGASSRIPDSTTYMETVTVTLQGTPVKVRTYDDEKKQLYRTQWWGRSPLGHPTIGSMQEPTYGKTGPTPLNCSSCHQVHNATSQIWQPPYYVDGYNNPSSNRATEGYKLLRRFPGATTLTGPGELTGTTAIAKVPESTLIADVNYSTNASMQTTYVDTDAAGQGDGLTWRQPDWVVGSQFSGYVANVNQYTLSVWCADCHNLNIGARGVVTGDAELGFGRAHAERTHPVPASRGFQCYSCHRSGLGAASGCNRCHYNNENYPLDAAAATNFLGQPSDFPHAGGDDEIKLLGAFSIASAPPATFPNTWDVVYTETAIGPDNLDAVCIRCHTDQGVHQ